MSMPDTDLCRRAMAARDPRFDGWFYVAVSTTRIYCRPSCPAVSPKPEHVTFYPTAAAAQAAGYRACLRCRPDAAPGSPAWNLTADVAGRAMRLIEDGIVDREGVEGLAARLAYSPRHLRRLLTEQLGAGPLDLARAHRAHTARLLIETTALPFNEIAFAAGFASLRQFNDTIRTVFARTPTEMRERAAKRRGGAGRGHASDDRATREGSSLGAIVLRLPFREPLDAAALLGFLAARAVPGVEEVDGQTYRRTLRLPHGVAVVELTPRAGHVECVLRLAELRDLATAVARCRALFDLDADPAAVDAALTADSLLAPLVAAAPGRRVPGATDGFELGVRAVLGQQISVAGARTTAGRLAETLGTPAVSAGGTLRRTFPTAETLAAADPADLPLPAARRQTVRALARAVLDDGLDLRPGADRDELRRRLLELPGIGPWTVEYVLMRLGDPDALPVTDHGVLRGLATLTGSQPTSREIETLAAPWRPWRAYAVQHLWGIEGPERAGQRRPVTGGPSRARPASRTRVVPGRRLQVGAG